MNPSTQLVLNVATQLKKKNALDLKTLRELAGSVDKLESIIDKARLTEQGKQAYMKLLTKHVPSVVDWTQLRKTLKDWVAEQEVRAGPQRDARRETAPVWNFQLLNKRSLSGNRAHIIEISKIENGGGTLHLLRIAEGSRHTLVLLDDGKSIAKFPLELGWSAHLGLAVRLKGKTFVPMSRSGGPSACRLVLLEKNLVLVNKDVGDDWFQPVGLLLHRERLLLLVARANLAVDGISQIDIASLAPNEPGRLTWNSLSLRATGLRIWWIGAVHTQRDEVLAVIDTDRGVMMCKLFCRIERTIR